MIPLTSFTSGARARARDLEGGCPDRIARARWHGRFALGSALALVGVAATAQDDCPVPAENFCVGQLMPSTDQCDTTGPAGTPLVRGVNCRFAQVDGFPREYIVYVPQNPEIDIATPLPVVIMAHGSSGDGGKFLAISGWREKADEEGLIAVFPSSVEVFFLDPDGPDRCTTKWTDPGLEDSIDLCIKPRLMAPGGQIIDYPQDAPWPADDLSFVETILADLSAGLAVDSERLYFSGFSSGAGFAEQVALELSHVFAAAGWAGGGLRSQLPLPPGGRRLPVSILLGECDNRVGAFFGFPLETTPCLAGQGGGIPVDVEELLAHPTSGAILRSLAEVQFGLEDDLYDVRQMATYSRVRWRTPVDGNDDGNELQVTMIADLGHEYPRCNENGCNNPSQFSAADTFWEFFERAGESGCVEDETTLCLVGSEGRFRVEVSWRDPEGKTGNGVALPFTEDSGLFWFFEPSNVEMLVKVLDACALNDRFWVFAAATTDVEYTLRVVDTQSGELVEYHNPLGTASPAITDTDALAVCP